MTTLKPKRHGGDQVTAGKISEENNRSDNNAKRTSKKRNPSIIK